MLDNMNFRAKKKFWKSVKIWIFFWPLCKLTAVPTANYNTKIVVEIWCHSKGFEFQRVKQQSSNSSGSSGTWLLRLGFFLFFFQDRWFSLWVCGSVDLKQQVHRSLLPLRLVARTTEHSAVPLSRPSSSEHF